MFAILANIDIGEATTAYRHVGLPVAAFTDEAEALSAFNDLSSEFAELRKNYRYDPLHPAWQRVVSKYPATFSASDYGVAHLYSVELVRFPPAGEVKTVSNAEVEYVTYAHHTDPNGIRFRDIKGGRYPHWAVDIQDEK